MTGTTFSRDGMNSSGRPQSFDILGYSDSSPSSIIETSFQSETQTLHTGDYTASLVDNQSGLVSRIVSAPIAALPAYYGFSPTGLPVFGSDVFTVARDAGLAWDWNIRAIRSLAMFGHTIGSDTLHPAVWRVPNDSVIEFTSGSAARRSLGFWDAAPERTDVGAALEESRRAFRRDAKCGNVLLSLSAGYDSRLLLGMCLAEGIKPRCVTMRTPQTDDMQVATGLAQRFGLTHQRIDLPADDYLRHGPTISRLTSGTKTAGNWHTYLYSREAGVIGADEVHVVGSNGEFARSFYLHAPPTPKGKHFNRWLSKAPIVASHLPARCAQDYWFARLQKRARDFRDFPIVAEAGLKETLRLSTMTVTNGSDMASSLDEFYATHRVRHFIGNGLALYAAHGRPRSPFLDARVVRSIRGLPREYKVDERFHVESMRKLDASLLDMPFNPRRPGAHDPPTVIAAVRALPAAADIIMDSTSLNSLIPVYQREALVKSGNNGSFELLLTLAFAANNV